MGKEERVNRTPLEEFMVESNRIEGIHVTKVTEVAAFSRFMELSDMSIEEVSALQRVFAPRKPLRSKLGMDVCVGRYVAPSGGPDILVKLSDTIWLARSSVNPWETHVAFEKLHPYMDGNGRTGRALWAWHMDRLGMNPFGLPFLHRFYYQTLENAK